MPLSPSTAIGELQTLLEEWESTQDSANAAYLATKDSHRLLRSRAGAEEYSRQLPRINAMEAEVQRYREIKHRIRQLAEEVSKDAGQRGIDTTSLRQLVTNWDESLLSAVRSILDRTGVAETAPPTNHSYTCPECNAVIAEKYRLLPRVPCACGRAEWFSMLLAAPVSAKPESNVAAVEYVRTSLPRWVLIAPTPPTSPPATTAEGASESGARSTPPADVWLFAPWGDGYSIKGPDGEGHFQGLDGFKYIAKLIRSPSKPVPMLDLLDTANDARFANDMMTPQPISDSEYRGKIGKQLQELSEGLQEALDNNDPARADQIRVEKEKLERLSIELWGFQGKVRDLNNPYDRMRSRITNSLKRAYTKLRKATQPLSQLAEHLELSISSENRAFVYRPVVMPEWQFDISEK